MENLGVKEIYFQEKSNFKSEIIYSLSLDTLEEKLVIINEKNISKINKLDLNKIIEKLKKFQSIIENWESNYISQHALDGITFKLVVVMNDGSIIKIIGRNKFPIGYSSFVKLVSGE